MTTLLLVEGDTKAQIQATITRSDTGSAVDLNDASSAVSYTHLTLPTKA